jgi:hypothetical protein
MAALLAVARRIAPPLAELDAAGVARFEVIVQQALAHRPPGVQRQFRLLLKAVSLLAIVRHGAPFSRLGSDRQDGLLRFLQDGPSRRLRVGFWGLKTLVFMGIYGQTEIAPRLAYAPSSRGNEHLRA